LLRQRADGVATQHIADLVGRDGLVLARAHPRGGHVTQAALLELLQQAAQAALRAAIGQHADHGADQGRIHAATGLLTALLAAQGTHDTAQNRIQQTHD
jgi:hypothetical protein